MATPTTTTFWDKNKVFILGLLGAIALSIQPFITAATFDWKTLGFAVLMAALSYIANTWRGQGVTITGILGMLAYAFATLQNTGHFTWQQFILAAAFAILAAVAPPPKPLSYEHSPTIVTAKVEATEIDKGVIPDAKTGEIKKP